MSANFAPLPEKMIAATLSVLDINILVSEEPIERDGIRWEKVDDELVAFHADGKVERCSFRAASNAVLAADFTFDSMEWA